MPFPAIFLVIIWILPPAPPPDAKEPPRPGKPSPPLASKDESYKETVPIEEIQIIPPPLPPRPAPEIPLPPPEPSYLASYL